METIILFPGLRGIKQSLAPNDFQARPDLRDLGLSWGGGLGGGIFFSIIPI